MKNLTTLEKVRYIKSMALNKTQKKLNIFGINKEKKLSTDLTIKQNFEEKFTDRVRDSIGDLLSDEELKAMITKAIDKIFFTERGGYHGQRPSLIEEIVRTHLKERLTQLTNEVIKAQEPRIKEIIMKETEGIVEKNVGMAVINAIGTMLHGPISEFSSQVRDKFSQVQNAIPNIYL